MCRVRHTPPPSALGVAVGRSSPMLHQEVEVLECKEPSCHPSICVFGPGHPLEGRVVRNEGELTAQKVAAQLQDCPLDGQSILLHSGVILLGRDQLPADIKDRMLLTFLNLGQDSSKSCAGGIHLQHEGTAEVRGPQDRLRAERCLHIPEGLLRFGCLPHLLWLPLPGQVCQGGG